MVAIQSAHMTLETFMRQYEEQPFEYIDGEQIQIMPGTSEHSYIAHVLFKALLQFLLQHMQGEVMHETTFILPDSYNAGWVTGSRQPDLMYYERERLETYKANTPNWLDIPYALVPDMVVEVIPAGSRYMDVDQKLRAYLKDGVKLVWLIDPRTKTVQVRQGVQANYLSEGDTLRGEAVIPGFEIAVKALFAIQHKSDKF